ncbi:MAG: MotA/TolQ/ExbB proton channel family protein [Deltaproteobacteria bacterium]|nr:MAG: MotA/TolQ/ExbB proton channel family protein [Deltaproteobacteria bacterium]RLA98291.1 MAG: MotA/TolQ/ExbB proton channel family protein [Deltaproteobacteria bacterium]
MYDLFLKGGILMYPIAFCSIVALGVFLERLWSLRKRKVIPQEFLMEIVDMVAKGKIREAITYCKRSDASIAHIAYAGIENYGKKRELIKERMEEVGKREVANLERYINVIGAIAGVAPLLGLLGTVSGMIKSFNVISLQGVADPGSLAGGISEALITTAAGLVVAIPAFVMYHYLRNKVDSLVVEMEEISVRMVELLKGEER